MKNSAVRPAVLFDPSRQKRLLDGLSERFRACTDEQQRLVLRHQQQRDDDRAESGTSVARTKADCIKQRRDLLEQWDASEEQITANYESETIKLRYDLNRLAALFRKKKKEEVAAIDRKVEARRQAVLQQYENRKNQPGKQRNKDHRLIDEAVKPVQDALESARELTTRRLDGLMDVPTQENPLEEFREEPPTSVKDAISAIRRLQKRGEETVHDMQSSAASKFVDSFYLPAGVAVFLLIWGVVAFFVAPDPPWMAMAAGVPVAGVLGFAIFAALQWPLRRMTRQLFPQSERIGQAAYRCAEIGKEISTAAAEEAANDLVKRREEHLAAAKQWQAKHLEELDERLKKEQDEQQNALQSTVEEVGSLYSATFEKTSAEMRTRADALAVKIQATLGHTNQSIEAEHAAREQHRRDELKRSAQRLQQGVRRGLDRIRGTDALVDHEFPAWDAVLQSLADNTDDRAIKTIDYLPIATLQIHQALRETILRDAADGAAEKDEQWLADSDIPKHLPLVLHRRVHNALVIHAPPSQMDRATEIAQQILWRMLTAAPAGGSNLTLIDPLGRGQGFTNFMALADHDPSIVGHRVWTTDQKIESRLGEIAHHVEDILQSILRDRFERIEDYNAEAGAMSEPYRAVAAIGLPESLTQNGYKHLRAIIESGMRCGIFTVLVCDSTQPWPSATPLPSSKNLMTLRIDDAGNCRVEGYGLDDLPVEVTPCPSNDLRTKLIDRIGVRAVSAARVEIPLAGIMADERSGTESTDDGIAIPVGSQGANRSLSVLLGEGVRQHVLIAGKTGSGKSTLLHSIITSGAHHYRPDQLQFYLLDFKKGVEFKTYADANLPHARIIGIESEREFGRSVLQRLDAELQQRGEAFRAAGVQELGDYRQATGKTMPRIILVVDEFQELFVRDDRLAGDCAMLLDRLVRQGRSFGLHAILSSQSLAGAYSIPRATLGQMAVRIAMQCSESDAALILADDNTAARLISRPGEAIYNDASGMVEGNRPFQVAWVESDWHKKSLSAIADRDAEYNETLPPPVIFEGNRPCRWTPALAGAATAESKNLSGLIGEAVEIGPPVAIELTRDPGRNVVLISPPESRAGVLGVALTGFAKSNSATEVVYFDGSRPDDGVQVAPWCAEAGINVEAVKTRDAEARMIAIAETIASRGDETDQPPIIVVVDPVERFRDLRQDESFSFSLDGGAAASGSSAFQQVLRDGPAANVYVVLVCSAAESLSRWLPRASQHDLELKVLGRMNANDSSLLIDTPMAAELSAATMLIYDDADGRITKFRQCDLPSASDVADYLKA